MPLDKIAVVGIDATGAPSATTFLRGDNAWADSGAIGVGQTWQSVTRTSGTTYTNATGKPIGFTWTGNVSSGVVFNLNGTPIQQSFDNTGQTIASLSVVIPPTATYSITVTGTVRYCFELR